MIVRYLALALVALLVAACGATTPAQLSDEVRARCIALDSEEVRLLADEIALQAGGLERLEEIRAYRRTLCAVGGVLPTLIFGAK